MIRSRGWRCALRQTLKKVESRIYISCISKLLFKDVMNKPSQKYNMNPPKVR